MYKYTKLIHFISLISFILKSFIKFKILSYRLETQFNLKASLAGTLFAQLAGSSHQLSDVGPEKNHHRHDPLCDHHHEQSPCLCSAAVPLDVSMDCQDNVARPAVEEYCVLWPRFYRLLRKTKYFLHMYLNDHI